LKQKGRSGRVEVGTKSERAEWELDGKFPPFSHLFSSPWFFFFFLLLKKKNMPRRSV